MDSPSRNVDVNQCYTYSTSFLSVIIDNNHIFPPYQQPFLTNEKMKRNSCIIKAYLICSEQILPVVKIRSWSLKLLT